MAVINIANLIGTPNAIIQKFGLMVFDEVKAVIQRDGKATLVFTDLNNVTTGFFHASIGNLVRAYRDKFNSLVEIQGLDKNPDWTEKFQDAIDLASNEKKATEIDQAISELFVS